MKTVVCTFLFWLSTDYGAIAQYMIPYQETGAKEHALARVLRDDGSFSDLHAELYSTILTIRSRDHLGAGDLLKIVEIVVDFYEDIQTEGLLQEGIEELRILWDLTDDDGEHSLYAAGIVVDTPALLFISSQSDAIEILRAFLVNVARVIPPDKFEDANDYRSGAIESLVEYHTLEIGDSDWFVYRPRSPGLFSIETKNVEQNSDTSSVDTIVNVFVNDYVVSDDDDGVGRYSKALVCAEDDPIYVEVAASESRLGYYRLEIEQIEGDACSRANDTPDDADAAVTRNIRDGIKASLHENDDVDWFRLNGLSRGRTYMATVASESSKVRGLLQVGEHGEIELRANRRVRFLLKSRGVINLKIQGEEIARYTVTIVEDRPQEL
ncbi:MAG: hypothetical protein OXQ31_17990 [Spirochaetaceae bacterium]|nr:hypothetical protein [Spirochaetaceae bacterium]